MLWLRSSNCVSCFLRIYIVYIIWAYLIVKLNQLRVLEERILRQKSKVSWQQEGDRNTMYFHKIASCRRISSIITPTIVGLIEEVSLSTIPSSVTTAFRNRFASGNSIHVKRWDIRFPCLDRVEANQQEVHFLEEESR